jgi:uncharacterized protein YvpB
VVSRLQVLLFVVVLAAMAALVVSRKDEGTSASGRASKPVTPLRLMAGEKVLAQLEPRQGLPPDRHAVRDALPARLHLREGIGVVSWRVSWRRTWRRIGTRTSGDVEVARAFSRSRIPARPILQAQRNTCESAALSILLDAMGVSVSQERLQQEIPRSGALDPIDEGGRRVWGDPERGYVGRPDGGGVAGGFGVYPRPVAAVARRHGSRLEDLTGGPPEVVYERLRAGWPVMAWIGLSDGPYGEWFAPDGRRVRVNFGEHTVVLTGLDTDGTLRVENPLTGVTERWTRQQFEIGWERLGRRGLAA